jgi:hypothetical protein
MSTYFTLLGLGGALWLAGVVVFSIVAALGEPKATSTEQKYAKVSRLVVALLNVAWLWAWIEAAQAAQLTTLALFLVMYAGAWSGYTLGNHVAAWTYGELTGYLGAVELIGEALARRFKKTEQAATPVESGS